MTIPGEIHARLSASERIRAAVSAMARGDDEELQTLKETCPKKSYLMTDPAYSEAMPKLYSLMLANEYDLACASLDFKFAGVFEGQECCDIQDSAMEKAATVAESWDLLVAELGIDPAEMAKTGPPRHFGVEALLEISQGEANPEKTEERLAGMRAYLATC